MPLNFPTNPVAGQGYQSGSSEAYQYNGSYWESIDETNILLIDIGVSASFTPSHRRNITAVSPGNFGNALIIADGKLFTHNVGSVLPIRTHAMFSTYLGFNNLSSPEFMYEIAFPTEAGTVVDANIYNTSAYALFNNGNLYTWGNNAVGQLGTGDTTFRGLPTLVQTGVTRVYWDESMGNGATDQCSLFIRKTDGKIYATGYNGNGQLGLGNTTNRTSFTEVTGLGTDPLYIGICGGGNAGWVIAQKSDGIIVATGYNGFGQLGIGNTTANITSWTTASGWLNGTPSMRIVDHVAGLGYNNGVQVDGSSQFWLSNGSSDILMGAGNPNYGLIADGGTGTTPISTPLRAINVPARFQKIVRAGTTYGATHLLGTNGIVYGWGWNSTGQIGNGTTTTTSSPQVVMSGVLDIDATGLNYFAGVNYSGPIARSVDGYYYTWGTNTHGVLGDGTTTQRNSPVRIRFPRGATFKFFTSVATADEQYTRIAIGEDNRYYCWGDNSSRAVDTNNTDDVLVPTEFSPRVLQR